MEMGEHNVYFKRGKRSYVYWVEIIQGQIKKFKFGDKVRRNKNVCRWTNKLLTDKEIVDKIER